MIAAKKAFSEGSREQPDDDDSDGRGSNEVEPSDGPASKEGGEDEERKEDAEWEQVGPKNKSTITRQVRDTVLVLYTHCCMVDTLHHCFRGDVHVHFGWSLWLHQSH